VDAGRARPAAGAATALTLRLRSDTARLAHGRLFDRALDETLHEDRDKGPDAGGVELAVEASHPILKVCGGDRFARVAPLKSAGDLGDLFVVSRLDFGRACTGAVERGWPIDLGGCPVGKLRC
jgi:hypothetical protein